MSFSPERTVEQPLAVLQQRSGSLRAVFELHVDRITTETNDVLGGRRLTLPLDTLSPHVVIRRRGSAWPLVAGVLLAVALALAPGISAPLAAVAAVVGGAGWWATRRQYIVFPGEIADLELFRDRPDAATARRFVAQIVARIEALAIEQRELQRESADKSGLDRVDELLKFRDLYAEGIIDRGDLRLAAEILARKEHGRIGFRRD